MTERLLQYIWQFQHFNTVHLDTVAGDSLEIIHPGVLNKNQGPDFTGARIRIGNTVLAGSVELHVKTSQWEAHGHSADPNYRNVILHVVHENNAAGPPAVPVLELQPRISALLLNRYAALMENNSSLPCAGLIAGVHSLTWSAWKERLIAERLTRKAAHIFTFLKTNGAHWDETFWWLLARCFGMKTNADAFEAVARATPMTVLARHRHQIIQVEALLLGQAGLLEQECEEAYPKLLQREYKFLRGKYGLQPIPIPMHFLRMRPGNFPTVRLAQLAALLCNNDRLFSQLLEAESLDSVKERLQATANDYWHQHYKLGEPSPFREKRIGADMVAHILINAVIPAVFAYGLYKKEERLKDKAVEWLSGLGSESNSITRLFHALGIVSKDAFDAQALTELKTQYCDQRHCLRCAIGNAILQRG